MKDVSYIDVVRVTEIQNDIGRYLARAIALVGEVGYWAKRIIDNTAFQQ
jgi:hypothetical protein